MATTTPGVGPAPAAPTSLTGAMDSVGMQVSKDNILQVRAALLAKADELLRFVRQAEFQQVQVTLCGGDPVSHQAAAAFNERIGMLVQNCRNYGLGLRTAGTSLDETARAYGYTEEQIASSFRSQDPGARA